MHKFRSKRAENKVVITSASGSILYLLLFTKAVEQVMENQKWSISRRYNCDTELRINKALFF